MNQPVAPQGDNRAARWQPPLSAAMRRNLARLLIGEMADEPDEIEARDGAQPEKVASGHAQPGAPAGIPGDAIGLVSVRPASLPYPAWVRGPTPDAQALEAAIADLGTGLRLPFAPPRIIDLPHHFGEVWLETRTALAEPGSSNACAWAEFVDPGFR